jgi:hypothetical protein
MRVRHAANLAAFRATFKERNRWHAGGLMDTAFEWVLHNGGIDTERDYRYHAVENVCSVNREHREVVTIDDYDDGAPPPRGVELPLASWLHVPLRLITASCCKHAGAMRAIMMLP